MNFMFYVGVSAAILKIFIGTNLLIKMRKKFYTPYLKTRHNIIITMISTTAIMGFNALINRLICEVDYAIFWLYVTVKLDVKDFVAIYKVIFEFLIYAFEVFLLYFTTDNINFRSYILYLMQGRRALHMVSKVSIFLIHIPDNSEPSILSDSDENSMKKLSKSNEEESRKFLKNYDSSHSYRMTVDESIRNHSNINYCSSLINNLHRESKFEKSTQDS